MNSSKEKVGQLVGQMTAVISGRDARFKASTINYLPGNAVFAIDDEAIDNEPFIYIHLPETPEVKTYDIEPLEAGKVWAHLGIEGAGYAQTGRLAIEVLGSSGEPKQASFDFKGGNSSFSVSDGHFEIDSQVRTLAAKASGTATAQVSPVLESNGGFTADQIRPLYNSAGELSGVLVSQREGLKGGLEDFGAFFLFTADSVTNYFAVVDRGLYAGQPSSGNPPIGKFEYRQGQSLLIEFEFEFTRSGKKYVLNSGRVELDLRPK
ncbi:hypothetical protein P3R38_04125 [Pseudomonas sp. NyZ480]|uniref:hypothetical protein n=1 Tax=Pseudomonas sp. NyZ480 TaxID=3035289 RepID=UPI002408FC3E|nr:hypothetical protein [Pseudomonas sp. NyZ480]WEZ89480.1 hypothetical protein P3R38_04125 [Pseudomonas sp. NyZ480]